MKKICMYLRKSREDVEAEKRGEGETLSKHRQILQKTAQNQSLNIIRIREEIVSGESLVHRPEMLMLLKELEQGLYDGVLCMDLDRLGRGNMQEQGLILETFKKSGVKIITPRKTYDLEDEFDEEYSEFEAFMARKELKLINRRLQRGRIRSVEEGNYIGSVPPFGYQIVHQDSHRTLQPHPDQGPVVKMIFQWYTEKIGANRIAAKLNQLGFKTATGLQWTHSPVLSILKNPVYTGKITWQKKKYTKSQNPGQNKMVQQQPKKDWIVAAGHHQPLISEEQFKTAQEMLQKKYHVPYKTKVTNPLAGLIKCKACGSSMVYRPYTASEPHLVCYRHCGCKSSKFSYVEARLLAALRQWLGDYRIQLESQGMACDEELQAAHRKALEKQENDLKELQAQKGNLHDLLERGIYDQSMFYSRVQILQERLDIHQQSICHIRRELAALEQQRTQNAKPLFVIENILDSYELTTDPKKKNMLLKALLHYAEYKKEKNQRNDEFTLVLYPKLPANNHR